MQKFLQLLQTVDADLDAEEIADILWLSQQINVVEPVSSPPPQKNTRTDSIDSSNRSDSSSSHGDNSSSKDRKAEVTLPPPSGNHLTQVPSKLPQARELPFKAPSAPGLRNKLKLARSLRPLMRRVPSRTKFGLDEEATAIAMLEKPSQQWLPVMKAAPERWLDLVLVIENSRSTMLWQELITEVQQLFERQGAFRTVRTWTLQLDVTAEIQLYPQQRTTKNSPRSRCAKELLDPTGQQLIVVLSDCVSPLWREGKIHPWLKEWSKHSLTAILQFLPERLWSRTALGLGSIVTLSAFTPGASNAQLNIHNLPGWNTVDRLADLILPIITLEPDSLDQWAKVLVGFGNAQVAGVVFDLDFVQEQSAATIADEQNLPVLDAESLLQRFRVMASPLARRLASLMSIVPISLPVVHLIQEAMLPSSRQVHVAEVFMSGLLMPLAQEYGRYEFVGNIREVLRGAVPKSEAMRLINEIAIYIAGRAGFAISGFAALLKLQSQQGNELGADASYFTEISTAVLRQMGKEYAAWVDELDRTGYEQQFESVTFEVVTIEQFRLEIFNFEVATISIATLTVDELLRVCSSAIEARTRAPMTAVQCEIIEGTWKNLNYAQIADREGLSTGYISKIGAALFQDLTEELGKNISKSNVVAVVREMTEKLVIKKRPGQALQFIESLSDGVDLEMVKIPAGEFLMGSPDDELERMSWESPQHVVTVPEFFMGKYPITQAQWRSVAQRPQVERELNIDPADFKGDNLPVENVSWHDAVEFCQRLSILTDQSYRLPSEAEWEYACRSGTTTPFHFGETISTDLANYRGTDEEKYGWSGSYGKGAKGVFRQATTAVDTFTANPFGLYDMHGNVWEWCQDHWHDNYEGAPINGTAWLNENDNRSHSLRGGSWNFDPLFCRSANRFYFISVIHYYDVGFRVVCNSARTP
jgi:formylglycine-generating enzyme required for sulfatase activity